MNNFIIGNIVALIASIMMIYTGFLNNRKKIIYFQTVQIGLSIISNTFLNGISGVIINMIGFIRNILCYKGQLKTKTKIIISIISIVLIIKFNNLGIIGFTPLIATITYIWLMTTEDTKKLKLLIAFTMLMWFIYDVKIGSYTSATFNFLNMLVNIITIKRLKKTKNLI